MVTIHYPGSKGSASWKGFGSLQELPALRVGHHDQPLALAEAGRRCPLRESGDALDHGEIHAAVLEPAHGPSAHHDIGEFHRGPPDSGGLIRGWCRP